MGVFLGGRFEVPHVYDSDFHHWVYRLYTTPCIYLLKNLNRTLFLKNKHFYFITGLFSPTKLSFWIRMNSLSLCANHNKRLHLKGYIRMKVN